MPGSGNNSEADIVVHVVSDGIISDDEAQGEIREDEVDTTKPVAWGKGDLCAAPFSDGKFYVGNIKEIKKLPRKVRAVVTFQGYDSDEDEVIDIEKLRKYSPKKKQSGALSQTASESETSMFSPLTGGEKDKELRSMFKDLDSSDEDSRFKTLEIKITANPKSKTIRGKKNFNNDSITKIKSNKGSPHVSHVPVNRVVSKEGDFKGSGFDESELDKPKFAFSPPNPKVPFELSARGENLTKKIPAPLNQYLRDYQREGIEFLYKHYVKGIGAILGDDMGLGKTVQVIGFLSAIMDKTGTRVDLNRLRPKFIRQLSGDDISMLEKDYQPVLIVCPGSVLYNWIDEFETWGYFSVGKYHQQYKTETLSNVKRGKLEVVITTFETLRENVPELNGVKWDAVIVDEVHKIKGLKAQVTEALGEINCLKRYGLTGTILQNNMMELWSIFDWANPGCLDSLSHFEREFVKKIEKGQRHDATKRQLAEARTRNLEFSKIRNKWMIRRTKDLISHQLPRKDDKVVFCQLTPFQEDIYKTILSFPDMKLILSKDKHCTCGSLTKRSKCCFKTNKKGESIKSLIFTYMHMLLKVSNHSALLLPSASSSDRQKEAYDELCQLAFRNHSQFLKEAESSSFMTLSDPKYCGKMKVLQGMLRILYRQNSKVLLFSYSTKILDILEHYVISEGYSYSRLDGSVSQKNRNTLVKEFNSNQSTFIFLISTKAGSLGLNLTGANIVIIFDPNWNPTHDIQAQDRAYRIGQQRDVKVYRLISAGSIEENIYLRQIYKQQLDNVAVGDANARRYFRAVQGDPKRKGELFGIENMFNFLSSNKSVTQKILERHKKMEENLGIKVSDFKIPTPTDEEQIDTGEDKPIKTTEQTLECLASELEEQESDNDSESEINHNRSNKRKFDISSDEESPIKKTKNRKSAVRFNISSDDESPIKRKIKKRASEDDVESVSDVFEKCDVVHIHENKKLIGGSRAEDYMTRCAIEDVYINHQFSQMPADNCMPLSESSEASDQDSDCEVTSKMKIPLLEKGSCTLANRRVLIGQTPPAVRRQMLLKMAEFNHQTGETFANRVRRSSDLELYNLLKEFYVSENKELQFIFKHTVGAPVLNQQKIQPGSSSKVREKRKKPVKGRSTKKKGCHYVSEDSAEEIKNEKTNSIFVKKENRYKPIVTERDLPSDSRGKADVIFVKKENRYRPIVTKSALPSDSRGKGDIKGRAKVKCSKEPVNTGAWVKDESKPVQTKQNPPPMDDKKEKEISLMNTESGSSHVNVLSKSDNATTTASQFVLDDLFDTRDQKRKSAPKKVKKSTDIIGDLDFNQKTSTKILSKTLGESANFKQKKKIATNILDILNL